MPMSTEIATRRSRLVALRVLACAAALVAGGSALAQDAGRAIIERAAEAAKKMQSFEARATIEGVGGYASFMPQGEATVRMVRAREEGNRLFDERVDGKIKPRGDADEATEITVRRTGDITIYVDHAGKVVQERAGANTMTPDGSLDDYVRLTELAKDEPFKRELAAESWEVEEAQEIGGVPVDVVYVTYATDTSRRARPTAMQSYTHARWYIAKGDSLPRRVDRIAAAGGLSFTLRATYTDVKTDTGLTVDALKIETPKGYTRQDITVREVQRPGGPDRVVEPREVTSRPTTPAKPAQPQYPAAPDFTLATASGELVTKESLNGEVSVFYFWGTWCVPCRVFSPLVSELAEKFEGEPVGVYGLAVRERSAEAPKAYMAENNYKHTLLLGEPEGRAIGADEAARAFKVRVYPSIALVGKEGELVDFWRPQSGVEPAALVGQVEQAIRDYLAKH